MPAEEWGSDEFAQRDLSRTDGYPRRDEGERALLEFVPGARGDSWTSAQARLIA
jgi:hypothetical protein